MKVGDLVKCIEGVCIGVDSGVGIIIQVMSYNEGQDASIHVQWPEDDLWYHPEDLEVLGEIN